ncbi:MAG: hypothetical protein AAGA00_07360 [Pseudomonadota bacterium]
MPRIPTRDRLRQGVPRSTGGILSAPRDFAGPAIRRTGRQLAAVAESVKSHDDRQNRAKQQRAALELARARAQWNAGQLAEQKSFTTERYPDHDSWARVYRTNAGAMQQQAAGMISDGGVRQRFVTEMQDDLEQVAVSVDRRAREAGMTARRREAERSLLQQVETAALQSDDDAKAVMGGVRASLQDMVDTGIISADEAAQRSVGYAQHYAERKMSRLTRQDPAMAVFALNAEQPGPAALIRQLYRFGPTSRWRGNASRAGYGSDTMTREDGAVVRIAPGMTVDRADAERDLQRRVGEARSGVANQIGGKLFNRLAPHVQAVLVSVGYTTGSLPEPIAAAARSGNVASIAAAISADADEDGRGFEQIRFQQAAIVSDESGRSYEQLLRRPSWVDMLRPDQRVELLDAASLEVERADARRALADRAHAWQVGYSVRSDIRAAYAAGSAPDIDPEDVLEELGPEKHRQWLETRRDAVEVAAKTQNMPTLPDAQIVQLIDARRPKPGRESAEREQKVHDRVVARADELMRERRDNPARAAMRVPSVRQALSETQDPLATSPQKVQALVREMVATQSALGVSRASTAPVPDEWADKIGATLLASSTGTDSESTDHLRSVRADIHSYFGEFADGVIAYSIARTGTLRSRSDNSGL